MTTNPVIYFEIPVLDLKRAAHFYSQLFDFSFELGTIDNYEMAFFPFSDQRSGITGALVKGDVYKPTHKGVILYFHTTDIDYTLTKAEQLGAKLLYPKTFNATYGFYVAELEDCEGNRIAIQQVCTS